MTAWFCCCDFFPTAEEAGHGTRPDGSGSARILAFLSHLEQERKNGVSTRNVRLSAIHAFFHFVASRNPEHLDLAQRVLGIPFKRARQRAIDYLEYEEIDAILKAINRTTWQGSRDYALLATMFNTGGRVQEIADLRACDLQLTKPFQVRLFGKGERSATVRYGRRPPQCCDHFAISGIWTCARNLACF